MFSQKNATQVDKSKWNLLGMKFTTAADLGNWGCLNLYSGQRPQQCHDDCVRNLVDELTKCGIRTSMPPTTHFNKDSTRVWQNWIRNCRHSLLLVVIPIKEPLLYSQIKKIGDIEAGIPTVCVTGQRNKFYNTAYTKGTPNSASYNANVALKMNIKRGGINHVLKGGQLGFISEGTTMVVGIDVTHPSPGSGSQATSVAAMVASSDKDLAQWPAQIRINPARQEKVDTLNSMLRAHLTYWAKLHGSFPEKLLIYRDGVSEGQYQMVLEEELPTLRAACESVYGKQDLPRITLIVVGKRHHTRFYKTNPRGDILEGPKDGNNPGMQGNPKFGTVSTFPFMSARLQPQHLHNHPQPSVLQFLHLHSTTQPTNSTPFSGHRHRNRRRDPKLGFLPPIPHRPPRHRPPRPLLCPRRRNLQTLQRLETLARLRNPLRLPLHPHLPHVLSLLPRHNLRQHPAARLLRRHCVRAGPVLEQQGI